MEVVSGVCHILQLNMQKFWVEMIKYSLSQAHLYSQSSETAVTLTELSKKKSFASGNVWMVPGVTM